MQQFKARVVSKWNEHIKMYQHHHLVKMKIANSKWYRLQGNIGFCRWEKVFTDDDIQEEEKNEDDDDGNMNVAGGAGAEHG